MEKLTNLLTDKTHLISILITQNGYSFFVLNTTDYQIEVCKTEELQVANAEIIFNGIKDELTQNWEKKFPNAQIKICYHHSYFGVVPNEIYTAEYASSYLKFNTKLYTNDSISCEVNSKLNLSIPFVPYINVHNELLNTYQTLDFTHSINEAINWAYQLCKQEEGEHAFAFVQKEAFVLILLKDEKLQLANYFEFKTAEDFAYYCLFALEQNNCDREEMHFSILGEISTESEVYQHLYTYIKNLSLISYKELNLKVNLSEDQESFFNINPFLALELCE